MIDLFKRVAALEERLNNIIRYGVVSEITSNNKVKVKFGDNLESPELPYLVNSSGSASVYFLPKVGDQVVIISKDGFINQGLVIPNIYKDNSAASNNDFSLVFEQGEINYKSGALTIKANTKVNIETETAEVKANKITLGDNTGGGVVCQKHTCSFSGGMHPIGSSKVEGAM